MKKILFIVLLCGFACLSLDAPKSIKETSENDTIFKHR